ncbi:MAG: PhnD/SsuA/transferrin family substrate-binding protein [Betaproteobacteria bacterium]|nr:PhnD/SsuA/transferrin family substrate-binding protein [Betaproteobacteria bacterium]
MKKAVSVTDIFSTSLFVLAAIAAIWAPVAKASSILSVSSEAKDTDRKWDLLDSSIPLAQYLAKVTGIPIRAEITHDLKGELVTSRNPAGFMMMGPAHVIGSALRHGYEPVAQTTGDVQVAIVALKSSGIDSVAKARGKRLYLPAEDSLATYMALAKFNADGISPKTHFKSITYGRFHGVGLYALTINSADIAVADLEVAKKFVESGNGVIIETTKPVPAFGIVINPKVSADTREKISRALLDAKPGALKAAGLDKYQFRKISKENYAEVAKMGYFTPALLAGAKVLSAEGVQDMMGKGAKYYDVRSEAEYKAAHVKDAVLLSYHEKSKKEIDFDPKLDEFKLVDTVKDKNAAIIFACNGGECWKSYKASKVALSAGYKSVFWFRGGLPEWREKNLPVER